MSHSQAKVLSRKMAKAREERYLETSRKRLDGIVSTKMRTAFIGALAAFEEEFGFLWGRGLAEHQLTAEHRDMQELWERARTGVLNNGNTQLRAVRNEIANHVIKWNRHHIQFVVKTEETDNE
jgi:hypothetical protein